MLGKSNLLENIPVFKISADFIKSPCHLIVVPRFNKTRVILPLMAATPCHSNVSGNGAHGPTLEIPTQADTLQKAQE